MYLMILIYFDILDDDAHDELIMKVKKRIQIPEDCNVLKAISL